MLLSELMYLDKILIFCLQILRFGFNFNDDGTINANSVTNTEYKA